MGLAASKQDPNVTVPQGQLGEVAIAERKMMADIEGKKVIFDKTTSDNINGLGQLINQFTKNDTQAIVEKIKNMQEFKGKLPDSLLNKVSDIHKRVLDTLDSSLTYDEKKKQLETDQGVASYIQKFVDKDMDDKMKTYLENPYITKDDTVLRGMTDVTNSIKTIRSKYKYFEYKYVQMNMFLVLFTQHIHKTVTKFLTETAALYEVREKYHLVLLHNVIKSFQNMFGDEAESLLAVDTSSFSESIRMLTQNIMEAMTKNRQMADQMKTDSMKDIIKFLMKETEFAEKLMTAVDEFKTENPGVRRPIARDARGNPVFGPAPNERDIRFKPDFIKAATFDKAIPGYKFTTGTQGTGYYLNTSRTPRNFLSEAEYRSYTGNRSLYNFRSMNDPKAYHGVGYYLKEQPSVDQFGRRVRFGLTGGFIRDGSMIPDTSFEGGEESAHEPGDIDGSDDKQDGGFFRDGSMLPQKFFDI